MSEENELNERIDQLTSEIRGLARTREEANPNAKAADGARYAAALDGSKEIADKLVGLEREVQSLRDEKKNADAAGERKAEIDDAVKAALSNVRAPSLAALIGEAKEPEDFSRQGFTDRMTAAMKGASIEHLKGSLSDKYRPGAFVTAIFLAKSRDAEDQARGKAMLKEIGAQFADIPEESANKATLGATGATGGYVLPNNLVDTLLKPATQEAVLQNLVTVINGVAVRGVDMPYRLGAPTRMTFQDWGTTKENLSETYGSYTATLGTMARIYDLGKQYLRFSAGAAEADVIDELTKAAILGENYYMIAGAGTGTVGSGDPTLGVYTSLNATPTFLGYKGAFSGASNSTVAGSFANACVSIMSSLAARSRRASAIIVDSTTFFTAIGQGSDTAGFWVSPTGGPTGFTRTASGGLAFWGVPIYYDVNLGTNSATKIAIGAEWSAFKLYRGMEFRIDSSDVAGDRWDKNLVGFRGEEEIGFNADSPVHVGAAQLLTAVIP